MKSYIVVLLERGVFLGSNFLNIVILSRYLEADDFGVLAIINAIISISYVLVDSGLGGSLIYHESERRDYNTIFTVNIIASVFIFTVIFLASPIVEGLYGYNNLWLLLSCAALVIIIRSLSLTSVVKLTKESRFLEQFKVGLISGLLGVLLTFYLVSSGFGIWAFVMQLVFTSIISTALYIILSKDKLRLYFDLETYKKHFNYGYKLTLSSLVANGYVSIQPIALGYFSSLANVGFFSQASKINNLHSSLTYSAIDKVSFPLLSRKKGKDFECAANTILNYSMLFSVFIALVIYWYAEFIVRIILGDGWALVADTLKLIAIAGPFLMLEAMNRVLLKSSGNASILLKSEFFKRTVSILILLFSMLTFDYRGFLFGIVLASIFCAGTSALIVHFSKITDIRNQIVWFILLASLLIVVALL
ncbi:oligosaccharide flippase family protein [Paraferrimonas haliotis]|uniref:oligosaccharide flippase family protein n=1 Tax=Paraferrimonas haliotis TaxID=2013866 RepID=UPI0013044607|nr:oligosaccharide flippase family protein [Paraferrimonas haliotis]